MGVVLSTDSTLAPVSFAGSVIGFVSFAFTLATFLRVVWTNVETFSEPASSVHTWLNNLREELIEEQASLRVLKKVNRARKKGRRRLPAYLQELVDVELDTVTLKTMSDTIKRLVKDFQHLERPFLHAGEDGIQQAKRRDPRRRSEHSPSPRFDHGNEKRPRTREGDARRRSQGSRFEREEDSDDEFWAQRVQYAPYNVSRRFNWLYNKAKAEYLMSSLSRVQTRRIARQVNGLLLLIREYGDSMLGAEDQISRLDSRLDRVVGVRRHD